mgnify:CR=1 FL=1
MDGKCRKPERSSRSKNPSFRDRPKRFFLDEDDDDDEQPTQETEASPEEVLQYAWETVCYVIWGKASAKGGQKVVEAAPEALKELYRQILFR